MRHKIFAALIAGVIALTTIAPTDAFARDRRGHRDYHSDRQYRGDHYRRHRDNNNEVAVGVLGLVLGLAVGSALASNNNPPPPSYPSQGAYNPGYNQGPYNQGYSQGAYNQGGYDEGYSAYEDDYGDRALEGGYAQAAPTHAGDSCIRQVEQWDPVSGRYAIVNVRQPCG